MKNSNPMKVSDRREETEKRVQSISILMKNIKIIHAINKLDAIQNNNLL